MPLTKPKAAVVRPHSVVNLLEDLICNITDHEPELMGPVELPLSELTVTITAKTEDGLKGVILAGFTPEKGLDVYERYGSCQRYNDLAQAFQEEVDHFRETTTIHSIEDLNE